MRSHRFGLRLAAALSLTALAACAVIPATGERRLALIPESQEIQIGKEAALQVEQSIGLVDDPALQKYVRAIAARLAAASERPDLPWRFGVLDDPTPNAFALPGGPVYLTRGLVNLMGSEAQLAAVLGHEIGHITARHSVQAISRQQLAQLGLGIGGIVMPELRQVGQAVGLGLDLLFLSYGRDAERQADELGFRYARREQYDVREMRNVFASLQRYGDLAERSALPSWLATHPAPAERIRAVEARLETDPPPPGARVGRADYLRRIDRLVYGENPRNGFFREHVFYHPELAFRFAVPSGWQAQNMARAVTAASPRRNAALQLTLAREGTPESAAEQFLADPAIQNVRTTRETINGLPAVVTLFDARVQDGILRGRVAHLTHRKVTYRFLTYAPAAQFGAFDSLSAQIIQSFAPVTDPQVLNVQPRRVAIVQVPRAMTLEEFNRLNPSVVPLNVLAILNQVADGTSRLESGRLVKRVVQA